MKLVFPAETPAAQQAAMAKLEKSGFNFTGWSPAADPQAEADGLCDALMTKRSRYGSQYREVEPNGTIH